MGINVGSLGREIGKQLKRYSQIIEDDMDAECEKIAKKAEREIKLLSPVRLGDYRKGWKVKTQSKTGSNTRVLYNRKHYRRTHLLENGYYTKKGGFVKGRPHIKPVEETVIEEFESAVERVIRNASR